MLYEDMSCSDFNVARVYPGRIEILKLSGYTQAATLKFHFDLGTSVPKGFLANGVNRIHGEHVLNLISSTEVTGGKGWLVGCNGNVAQCGKIA